MTTTTNVDTSVMDIEPAPVAVVGDFYDGTADWSLRDIAARVREDILTVQNDDLIHADADFTVTTDETGPQGQIHITISGLPHSDHGSADTPSRDITRAIFRSVFVLASHYNRFTSSPYQLRYLVVIRAIHDSGAVYAEGVGAIGLWGELSQPEPAEAALHDG
ncbi:hypothetical protein [Amycolatopsis sp. YIM 10]|uniref:hypothetical protein n=1 Tax=Amycolatopsis sp. YIM 10 TaxID=2653857 RepID=UPI0012900F6A|nr:hypothetical protein [Amycolatopsis sp. YIM 10]QFU86747.1 hypothetical protein YIM_07680 [Amycolatopsis sp. YIM 10]